MCAVFVETLVNYKFLYKLTNVESEDKIVTLLNVFTLVGMHISPETRMTVCSLTEFLALILM